MSHHILHVLAHGSFLTKDRGLICLRCADGSFRTLPLEDLRAVIIAARGVSISSAFISAVVASNAVILHCDETYRPCGITASCARVIDIQTAYAQASRDLKVHGSLWGRLLKAKVSNQNSLLVSAGVDVPALARQIDKGPINESLAARHYWKHYFPLLGHPAVNRKDEKSPINHKLNYGYAVLSAICHRSVIIHGLSPLFGIHHIPRYQAHAFVYDVIEPLRPFVDGFLMEFEKRGGGEMKNWCKKVAEGLIGQRVVRGGIRFKLLDAVDLYISSIASCFSKKSVKPLWIPEYAG